MLKNLVHNFLMAWKFPCWRWALVTAVLSVNAWAMAKPLLVVPSSPAVEVKNCGVHFTKNRWGI